MRPRPQIMLDRIQSAYAGDVATEIITTAAVHDTGQNLQVQFAKTYQFRVYIRAITGYNNSTKGMNTYG